MLARRCVADRHRILVHHRERIEGLAIHARVTTQRKRWRHRLLPHQLGTRTPAATSILKHVVQQHTPRYLRRNPRDGAVHNAVIRGRVQTALRPASLVAQLGRRGILRLQPRIADLDQLGLVVLGEDANVDFIRPIHAPIKEQRQPVGVIELVSRAHIRKRLEVAIAIALVGVVIGIHVVVHPHPLEPNTTLELCTLALVHVRAIQRGNRFAIRGPTAGTRVDRGVPARKELHVHRDRAVPSLEAGLYAPLSQGLDVVRIDIHHVLVRQQLEGVGANERGHRVREEVLLVFAMERVVARERDRVPGLGELMRKYRRREGGVLHFVFEELPQAVAILQRADEVRIVAVVENLLAVEQPRHRQGIAFIERMVHARIQRGVVGTAITLHLLRDHRAVVVRARGEFVLVERGRVEPIRLQQAVRGAAAIVHRGRRIELRRALILRANGGQVLLLHPQRAGPAHEPKLAVEPLLLLLLEHQVDDAGAGVRVELGRRIIDDLDALERRCREVVQSVL